MQICRYGESCKRWVSNQSRNPVNQIVHSESTVIPSWQFWYGELGVGIWMRCVAQDVLSPIYGKTAQWQVTESLAAIKLSQVRDLSFAVIVSTLCTQWVYDRAGSLALSDKNLIVDNWLQISSYWFKVLPLASVSQYENITLLTLLILLGVTTRPSMVVGKDDEAVNNVISESSFGCHMIVKVLDHRIYLSKTDIEERQGQYYQGLHNPCWDLNTVNYCPSRTEGWSLTRFPFII